MSLFTHCALAFTVEQTSLPIAALQRQLRLVPIPTDLLTGLGVYVETDATTTVTIGSRSAAKRSILLRLGATSAATIAAAQDSNNRLIDADIVSNGGGYGGQPLYDMSQFLKASPAGGTLPPNRNGLGVPQVVCLMKVDAVIVGQGGSGYTAPVVTFEGNTVTNDGVHEGGVRATGTATVGGGGTITGITVATSGSGYCMAPRVVITDPTGEGAQAMATLALSSTRITAPGNSVLDLTLFPASPTSEAFDLVGGPTATSVAFMLGNLMTQAIRNATGFPVIVAAPVVT